MNETPTDLLQIKIENAKRDLSEETLQAINAVNWKDVVLGMRQKKGYSFEQIETLGVETELVLCGLLSSEDYPKQLESRMHLSKTQVNELLSELNDSVFKKIREEYIKRVEEKRKKQKEEPEPTNEIKDVLGEPFQTELKKEEPEPPNEIKDVLEEPFQTELKKEEPHPILTQKFIGPIKTEPSKTNYSFQEKDSSADSSFAKKEKSDIIIEKTPLPKEANSLETPAPRIDPYREIPE